MRSRAVLHAMARKPFVPCPRCCVAGRLLVSPQRWPLRRSFASGAGSRPARPRYGRAREVAAASPPPATSEGGEDAMLDEHNMSMMLAAMDVPVQSEAAQVAAHLATLPTSLEHYFEARPRTVGSYVRLMQAQIAQDQPQLALATFEDLQRSGLTPDHGAYNTVMNAAAHLKDPQRVKRLMENMKLAGLQPDQYTYNILVKVFMAVGQVENAFRVLDRVRQVGLQPELVMYTSLITGCIKNSRLEKAWDAFRWLTSEWGEPDEVVYTTMITACARRAQVEQAMLLYRRMQDLELQPTEVTYTSLIHACARRLDYYDEAFQMFNQMKTANYVPTLVTMNALLLACSRSGDVVGAERVFRDIYEAEWTPDMFTFTTLLNTYARGMRLGTQVHREYVAKAERLWSKWWTVRPNSKPNAFALNAYLNVYAEAGRDKQVMRVFDLFAEHKVKPTLHTWTALIKMYGRIRKPDDLIRTLARALKEGAVLDLVAYRWAINGLARAWYINSAVALLEQMVYQDGLVPARMHLKLLRQRCRAGRFWTTAARIEELVKAAQERTTEHPALEQQRKAKFLELLAGGDKPWLRDGHELEEGPSAHADLQQSHALGHMPAQEAGRKVSRPTPPQPSTLGPRNVAGGLPL